MFVGHFAVALASKRAAPRTSLGTLLLAATWSDVVYTVLLLAGVEHAVQRVYQALTIGLWFARRAR